MAGKRVLFLQLEIFVNCSPHLGMCLFIKDLRRQGIDCVTYLVNCNHVEGILPVIKEGDFSLICLDSCFTVEIIHELTALFPEIPILIGGVNSIALLLHTNAQFAVFGPGRQAVREFMLEFFGGRDFTKVTNLFFKEADKIFYSGKTGYWDLTQELFPFEPHLNWEYLGPERSVNADTEAVSIIAGTGCPYSRAVRSLETYDTEEVIKRLGFEVDEKALQRLEEIFNTRHHGCSFCVFQLQEYTSYAVKKTTEMLLQQVRHLSETHGTSAFHIQTENPFPFLDAFIRRVLEEGIPLDFVSIRTRPDTLVRQKDVLERVLDTARRKDFHFSIEEIGFESFVKEELALFDKGVDREMNLKALKLLRKLKASYGSHLSIHVGHGLILFHPWTTVESLVGNLEVMADYQDVFPRFYPLSLTLYSEFLPIFPKVMGAGLAVPVDYAYGWDYEQKDPLVRKAYELYETLYDYFGPDISIASYLDAVRQINKYSIDEILFRQFGLESVEPQKQAHSPLF